MKTQLRNLLLSRSTQLTTIFLVLVLTAFFVEQPQKQECAYCPEHAIAVGIDTLVVSIFDISNNIFVRTEPIEPDANFPVEPPPPGQPWTDEYSDLQPVSSCGESTSLIDQAAKSNRDTIIQNVEALLEVDWNIAQATLDLSPKPGCPICRIEQNPNNFGGQSISELVYANFGQLMGKWSGEFGDGLIGLVSKEKTQ